MAGVIEMSDQELTRLRVMIDLADDRLTVDAAATLMGLGRRQIYRLRRIYPDSAGTRTNHLPKREIGILLTE